MKADWRAKTYLGTPIIQLRFHCSCLFIDGITRPALSLLGGIIKESGHLYILTRFLVVKILLFSQEWGEEPGQLASMDASTEETVTLLRFGPRNSRHIPSRSKDKKSEKFSFKFRRRSKSAPRQQNTSEQAGRIVYSANGETKVKNPDSPFKSDAVQLVGFTTFTGTPDGEPGGPGASGACHSLDSADTAGHYSQCLDSHHRAASDSRTLSRWGSVF